MHNPSEFIESIMEYLVAAGYTEEEVGQMTVPAAVDLFILIFEMESGNIDGI